MFVAKEGARQLARNQGLNAKIPPSPGEGDGGISLRSRSAGWGLPGWPIGYSPRGCLLSVVPGCSRAPPCAVGDEPVRSAVGAQDRRDDGERGAGDDGVPAADL